MEAWAQLVSTTDINSEPVVISKEKFTIGRAQGSDLCFMENKLVSGNHCFIERDSAQNIWLQDNSTNGTLLNSNQKVSRQRVPLNHGDEILIVYQKSDTNHNIAYLFQELGRLQQEREDITDRESCELDRTLSYDDSCLRMHDDSEKESKIASSNQEKEIKAVDDNPVEPLIKHARHGSLKRLSIATSNILDGSTGSKNPVDENKNEKETATDSEFNACQIQEVQNSHEMLNSEESTTVTSAQPLFPAISTEKNVSIVVAVVDQGESIATPSLENCLLTKSVPTVNSDSSQSSSKLDSGKMDAIEDALICIICQEILHDSVSLQPCLHTFCAGCYSEWMEKSNECPSCRTQVERIGKNHMVNKTVEAYLEVHPGKRRSQEELKEIDAKNKITRDMMMLPKRRKHHHEEYEEYWSSSGAEEDDDVDNVDQFLGNVWRAPVITYNPTAAVPLGRIRPPKTVCRQCPEYRGPAPMTLLGPATSVAEAAAGFPCTSAVASNNSSAFGASCVPGTSTNMDSSKMIAASVNYQCKQNQDHVLCFCCQQPMPDRRLDRTVFPNLVPTQECDICQKAFCHLYWGCRGRCQGCLSHFEDSKFNPEVLNGLILENIFESSVFKTYLTEMGLNIGDLQRECIQKFRSGEYTCPGARILLRRDANICYFCSLKNFSELAYQFRRDIPADLLPERAKGRPNCYWGRNCRTQKTRPAHAESYNHICEQTRQA